MSCRNEVLQLPDEVLSKIFSFLDNTSIRTARIACRGFRAASVQSIKSLSFKWLSIRDIDQDALEPQLNVLTAVTHLTLRLIVPIDTSILAVPGALPKLSKLDLVLEGEPYSCMEDISVKLTSATQLTSLVLSVAWQDKPQFNAMLSQLFGACHTLEELTVDHRNFFMRQRLRRAILQAPILSRLRALSISGAFMSWDGSMDNRWTSITGLQALDCVYRPGQYMAALT